MVFSKYPTDTFNPWYFLPTASELFEGVGLFVGLALKVWRENKKNNELFDAWFLLNNHT